MKVILHWIFCSLALAAIESQAMRFSPFGQHGEGGAKNGQEFLIGPGGVVHEIDAFLQIGGLDLNGTEPGMSAALSRHPLPSGLNYRFSSALSTDQTDLVLTYTFSNVTAAVMPDLRFFVLLDAEIDQARNTFFNEFATVLGSGGGGAFDAAPDLWQAGEPGFQGGTLIGNLLAGSLNNSNAVPQSAPDDVALALGFYLGNVEPGDAVTVRVMISEDGSSRGSLALVQKDGAPDSPTVITLSGEAEPKSVIAPAPLVQMNFRWGLDPATGHLLGTVLLANPATNTAVFGPPFRLGLRPSPDFALVHPAGILDNGLPYVDLSAAAASQLGIGGALDPGELIVADGIEIDGPSPSPPPPGLLELWAARVR